MKLPDVETHTHLSTTGLSIIKTALRWIRAHQFGELIELTCETVNYTTITPYFFPAIHTKAFFTEYTHKVFMCSTGMKEKW